MQETDNNLLLAMLIGIKTDETSTPWVDWTLVKYLKFCR